MRGNELRLRLLTNGDMPAFFTLLDAYMKELAETADLGEPFDLAYFMGEEYRETLKKLRAREQDPLRVLLFKLNGHTVGFCMYVTYFREGGKCLLMEFEVIPANRGQGLGRTAFALCEKTIRNEGAAYIELTPVSEGTARFWSKQGFFATREVDEDGKPIYRKEL